MNARVNFSTALESKVTSALIVKSADLLLACDSKHRHYRMFDVG